jgi:hypothetical protein
VATQPFLALVDSGADVSTFHVSVALNLGIDLTGCRLTTLKGIGGELSVYACQVEMEIAGSRFPAEVRFVPSIVALLGRDDVFR